MLTRPQLLGCVALTFASAGCRRAPVPTAATTPARSEPDATTTAAAVPGPAADAPPELMTLPEENEARADAIEAWIERIDDRDEPERREIYLDVAVLYVEYWRGEPVSLYLDWGIDNVDTGEVTGGVVMREGTEHERHRAYYLFNGELVAVTDERKDTWVSGAEGTLWCPELDVTATVLVRGDEVLRSEVQDDTPSECSGGGSDDGEEEPEPEPPPPDLPYYMAPDGLQKEVAHFLAVEAGELPPSMPPDPLD